MPFPGPCLRLLLLLLNFLKALLPLHRKTYEPGGSNGGADIELTANKLRLTFNKRKRLN